jgi:hypothetical protein
MARDLFIDPIDEIKFDDIANLVSEQVEEGIRLEFKRDLSTSDGKPDRWMRDQSTIGRVARDDIAKEVVAFANAYGGIIIVGIDETEDHPHRAKRVASPQIPRVVDCAEKLIRALRSIIDPPLPMLYVRGVASNDATGEGVVLIRVQSSPSAPHGFGTPPAAYVRHGSESRPLSMRELQSTFFERRTRLERVTNRRKELAAFAQELWVSRMEGRLHMPAQPKEPFGRDMNAIQFRCSLVPTDDLAIDNFPDRFLGSQSQASPRPEIGFGDVISVVELPGLTSEWRRRYRAVEHRSSDFASALDGELWNAGAQVRTSRNYDEWNVVPWLRESIGPYSVSNRETFQRTFDVIERELWDAFRLRRLEGLRFDLTKVFQSIGL